MEIIREYKDNRPMTDAEKVFRAGVALGQGIDRGWLLDDETGYWIHPDLVETQP